MLATWLGWLGTCGTLGAYVLLSRGQLSAKSKRYAAMNLVGGLLAGTACVLYGGWPAAVSNYVWAVIGMHSLIRASRRDPAAAPLLVRTPVAVD